MFLRLCTRAPCTAMVVRASGFGADLALPGITSVRSAEKSQLMHFRIAPFGQPNGKWRLPDQPLVGEVFASNRHTCKAEIALKVIFNLRGRSGFPNFGKVLDGRSEYDGRALAEVFFDGGECSEDRRPAFLAVQHVRVNDLEKRRVELAGLGEDFTVDQHAGMEHLDPGQGVSGV